MANSIKYGYAFYFDAHYNAFDINFHYNRPATILHGFVPPAMGTIDLRTAFSTL